MDDLPYLEDVEVAGSHVRFMAHHLQDGAGPGGCDASHWRDILLRYGASSASLHDTVAALYQIARTCLSVYS